MFKFIFKNPFVYIAIIVAAGYFLFQKMNEAPDYPTEEVKAKFVHLLKKDKRYKQITIQKCIRVISGLKGDPPAYECLVRYVAIDPSSTPDGVKVTNFVYGPFDSSGKYVWTAHFLKNYRYYDHLPSLKQGS